MDSRCFSAAHFSSVPVVPPIVANEKDRRFLMNISHWIKDELAKVDEHDPEQRYIVHREAFDMVIRHVTAYKPLLNAIKVDYENCINTIRGGQREALFLAGKLNEIANGPSTTTNYKRRTEDLNKKILVINDDNTRRRKQLDELRMTRLECDNRLLLTSEAKEMKVKHRGPVRGLSLEQSTDVILLTCDLEKLEKQFKDFSLTHHNRFSTKDTKESLKEELSNKIFLKDQQEEELKLLKQRQVQLSIAVQAGQAYLKIQPPFQMISEAVLAALAKHVKISNPVTDDISHHESQSSATDDDDPLREKEAEKMLAYIEKFNELMDEEKFEEAAVHAANGLKGILRTHETLQRFKDVSSWMSGNRCKVRSPLLAYCESIMSTVPAVGVKPDEYISLECVRCALSNDRLDLILHWLQQERMTLSEKMGDEIYKYYANQPQGVFSSLAMAQSIYLGVGSHVLAIVCMVQQGRHIQAASYAWRKGCTVDDLVQVIIRCHDSLQFVKILCGASESKTVDAGGQGVVQHLPLGVLITALLQTDSQSIALNLLAELCVQVLSDLDNEDDPSSPLRRLVMDDNVTSQVEWMRIVQHCQDGGYAGCTLELLSALAASSALRRSNENLQQIKNNLSDDITILTCCELNK